MSPLLGSIGGISEYNYRGTLDDWPNPFLFTNVADVEPGTTVGISTVITGINYKAPVTASTGSQVSVRNIIGITSIYSGNGTTPSNVVSVSIANSTTELSVGKNIRIINVSNSSYNGDFLIESIVNPVGTYVTQFTYIVPQIPTNAKPGIGTAQFNYEVYPFVENELIYIRNGQILEVRIPTALTQNTDFDKQYKTTVRVGKRYSDWNIRTRQKDNTPRPFFFDDANGLNVGIATTSNSIVINDLEPGFSSYAFISSGIGSFSVNNSVGVTTSNVSNGDIIYMNEVSSDSYSTTKTSSITVGTYTTKFNTTTRNVDKSVNQFYFNDLINVPINQDQISISALLSGADNNIPLTAQVSFPGQLKVNANNHISGYTEVFNGDTISLKIPASAIKEYGTTYSTQLTVSGISSVFSVTSRPRPIKTFPDQFAFTDLNSANPNAFVESSVITLSGMTVGIADTGLATINGGGCQFKVIRNGSIIRDYSIDPFPVKNSDQIQLKIISAGENSQTQSKLLISGVDTRDIIGGVNGSTSDTWNVISRLLNCKINDISFRSALLTVNNAKIRELKSTTFTVSGLDNNCDTFITSSNPDSYIINQNGSQVSGLQTLDIKNADVITIYMTAASTYNTDKVTTIETKRRNGSDLISGTWTIKTQLEDRLPDAFNLPTRDQTNVSPCTYISTFVTESLSGLSQETIVPATVTSTNGTAQISKNNGIFGTSISGGVKNADRIDIRFKSNCNYGGPCEVATVSVGDRIENWTICPEIIPLPTVTLSSNANNIQYNGSVTLTWTSTFATAVTSTSGTGFVGIGSTQGTIIIPNLKANTTYSITISNSKGSATSTIPIIVAPEPAPTITLVANNNNTQAPIYTEVPEGIYANGKYVFISGYEQYSTAATTIEGKSFIHISTNGNSWEIIDPNTNSLLKDICYDGSSTFVAVGGRGTILRSTDDWQTNNNYSISSANFVGNYAEGFLSVTYGNGKFVATPQTSTISSIIKLFVSTNGINWSQQSITSIADGQAWFKIRFLNGYFYALTNNNTSSTTKIYRSSDALSWTEVYSYSNNRAYLLDIIYDGSRYIAVGNNGSSFGVIVKSIDGITWSVSFETAKIGLYHVESNGTLIIAHSAAGSGAGSVYYTSADGGNVWVERNISTQTTIYRAGYESGPIIFDGTKFVSMSGSNTSWSFVCRTTINGINWDFTNQSIKHKVIANNSNNSPSDSVGRYYNISSGSGSSGVVSWSLVGSTYYKTITGMYEYILSVQNSNGSFVRLTSLYGGSSVLTWVSSNAISVVSTSGIGFTNITSVNGSTTITPTTTTNYSITVRNNSGVTATATETVYINNPTILPTVTLSSSNLISGNTISVNPGSSIVLNWSSTNGTSISAYSGFGFIPTSLSGSLTINNINQNTSYSISITGPGGTVTSNVINVTLNSSSVTLTASPSTVKHNGTATLTWASSNATSVQSSNFGASSVSGSLLVSNLTSTTSTSSVKTYTITVTGPGGASSASVNVTILPPPPTASLTANPVSVAYGGSTILTWITANASALTSNFGQSALNGSTTIANIISNKTYTINAVGVDGVTTSTSSVDIVVGAPAPTVNLCASRISTAYGPIDSICAASRSIAYKETFRLEWTSTNATSVTGTGFVPTTVSGSIDIVNITQTTTYTITVSGSGGTATDSIRIDVQPCIPNTFQDSFASYKLATITFNNGTIISPPPYNSVNPLTLFTSTIAKSSLPGRPNYSYALMHEFIYNSYRTILNRSPEKEGLDFYINQFILNKSQYRTFPELYNLININAATEINDRASKNGLKSITDSCSNIWDTTAPLPSVTTCSVAVIPDVATNSNYINAFQVYGNGVDDTIQPYFTSTIDPNITLPNRPEFTYGQVHSYIKSVYTSPTTATSGLGRPPDKSGFVYYVSEFQVKLSDGTFKYKLLADLGVSMNAARTIELQIRTQNNGFVAVVDTCGKVWSY